MSDPATVRCSFDTGLPDLPKTRAVQAIFGHTAIEDPDPRYDSLLEEWVKHFLKKQQDYGDWANELGIKGQFADMYRKWPKLRKVMWEDGSLVGEQIDEVLMDFIGHAFLTLMFVRNQEKGNK